MNGRKLKSIGLLTAVSLIVILTVFVVLRNNHWKKKYLSSVKYKTQANNYPSYSQTHSDKSFTFVLTHLLDTKLAKNAYFIVGDMKVWELDFKNGKTINYTIISMNPDNPMCGITAKDNFGDTCEICITKTSGDNTKVEFKYNSKRLTYTGYLLR
jgi:hypothetical protein